MLTVGFYFGITSLRGDDGLYQRLEAEAKADQLGTALDTLAVDVKALRNRTRRLSDSYLDLDLLDQQARDVLGYVRPDEIVIR
jgi:cell division protein FtsB